MSKAPARAILNIGAGNRIIQGAVNHDLQKHRPEIDIAHDLNILPWPWEDDSFDLIVACAVLEHLRINLIDSVNECWRILRPGGILHMKLPYWNHANSYRDPTHYWRFDLRTCDLFDPDTKYGRDYSFYPTRKWQIIKPARLNKIGSSFALKMQVRKEVESEQCAEPGGGEQDHPGRDQSRPAEAQAGD